MENLEEIKIRSITGGNLHRHSFVFHILWNGTPKFWHYHSLILDTESYQLSTNGIEQTWAKPTTAIFSTIFHFSPNIRIKDVPL